jgi:short-subunit dehydrogenase
VIITGCSSGIGRAAAFHFARNGFAVVATVRQEYELMILQAELHQASVHTLVSKCDITSEEDAKRLIETTHERFGRVDVLINNAGFGRFGGVEIVSDDEARAQLEVNTIAPMRLAQLVLPIMREQGRGRIINISSVAGRVVLPWGGWYSASKFALEALTDALRLECKPFNIHVVSVLAGSVRSAFTKNVYLSPPERVSLPLYNRIHEHAVARRSKPRPGAWDVERMAKLLFHIATTRRPRTRYVTTSVAKVAVFLRNILPDRLWDIFILRAYGAHSILKNPAK